MTMFLGSYRFEGDPRLLLAGYDRMIAEFPSEALTLHVCLSDDSGITVLDGCPTRSELESFAASPEFAAALAAAGLPTPVLRPVGEVHHALINTAEAEPATR
jgi:hypothetical protein